MKTKHGISLELTNLLSGPAAQIFASWVGGQTVVYNQKTRDFNDAQARWIAEGKPENSKPVANQEVSHLQDKLAFLKELPAQIRRNGGSRWYAAVQSHEKGLRGMPVVRAKSKKRSCYVTNELFVVQAIDENRCVIHFKKTAKKNTAGDFFFGVEIPRSKEALANSLYISRKGRRFWLSIAYDVEFDVPSETEIKQQLSALTEKEILAVAEGFDIGIANQVMSAAGVRYHYSEAERERLAKRERQRIKYQRKYARVQRANDRAALNAGPCKLRKNGAVDRPVTRREKQWLSRAAQVDAKIAGIKYNGSHHLSKQIAEDTPLVAAFEDINLRNLRRKPKAKQCQETGKWLRNGAAAKRGLNKAFADVNLGQLRDMVKYKLADRGKLMIKVPAHHTSQTCPACKHVEPDNRESQSDFRCQKCGYTGHADVVGGMNIKERVISVIRDPSFLKGKKSRVTALRKRKEKLAPEPASSGSGEQVRPPCAAPLDDAPNLPGDPACSVSQMPRINAQA